MTLRDSASPAGEARLSEIYDQALPQVYQYLRSRCGSAVLAEELTSATFVQAATTWARGKAPSVTVPWLITVARNKLIDHWRHQAVVERSLVLLDGGLESVDPWDAVLDQKRASDVLQALPAHYRSALMLRYLDDLSVPECAVLLDKSVHATESLLVRARNAFRMTYEQTGGHDD